MKEIWPKDGRRIFWPRDSRRKVFDLGIAGERFWPGDSRRKGGRANCTGVSLPVCDYHDQWSQCWRSWWLWSLIINMIVARTSTMRAMWEGSLWEREEEGERQSWSRGNLATPEAAAATNENEGWWSTVWGNFWLDKKIDLMWTWQLGK